jgi:hypothetical protein
MYIDDIEGSHPIKKRILEIKTRDHINVFDI